MKKKRLLFVINTLGMGGAEVALLRLLRCIDPAAYDIDLYVMLGQGELIDRLPPYVRLVNHTFHPIDVLSSKGRRCLLKTVLRSCLVRCSLLKNAGYLAKNLIRMRKSGRVHADKLLWKVVADSAPMPEKHYDLAVAFLEGGSTYFVATHVRARRKVAFLHISYSEAGNSADLDQGCYDYFDQVFCVSNEVRASFLSAYPNYAGKTRVFHNILSPSEIRERSQEGEGFSDAFPGRRILTVCRLVPQKKLEVSVEAMRLLKQREDLPEVRWYVMGEGRSRARLEKAIYRDGLEGCFVLMGTRDNPYPYFKEADIYVHCTAYEGKSVAVEEAQILSKPVIVSDAPGNRDQVKDGYDGMLVPLEAERIAEAVSWMLLNPSAAKQMGLRASQRDFSGGDLALLLEGGPAPAEALCS
ncbi:glycosyltransferase [Olsenella porci]|uniref:Glycosyltransferase n=1 Tax=Olsenella porci TaxID=2652279 RepID=A0A6N7XT11_9ACTN|nr:glycosyltransferase [Olsenella porci]MST72501.1 glycosyltransferase [Olsenella porci]